MFKKLVIACIIFTFLPVIIALNDQIKLNDYTPISQQTHDDTIINPKIINYIQKLVIRLK